MDGYAQMHTYASTLIATESWKECRSVVCKTPAVCRRSSNNKRDTVLAQFKRFLSISPWVFTHITYSSSNCTDLIWEHGGDQAPPFGGSRALHCGEQSAGTETPHLTIPSLTRGFGMSVLPVRYWHQPERRTSVYADSPLTTGGTCPQLHPYITPVSPECCPKSNQSGFILFQEVSHSWAAVKTDKSSHSWTLLEQVEPGTAELRSKDFKHLLKFDSRSVGAALHLTQRGTKRILERAASCTFYFCPSWSWDLFFGTNTLFQHPANITMHINKKYQTLSLKSAKLPILNRIPQKEFKLDDVCGPFLIGISTQSKGRSQ